MDTEAPNNINYQILVHNTDTLTQTDTYLNNNSLKQLHLSWSPQGFLCIKLNSNQNKNQSLSICLCSLNLSLLCLLCLLPSTRTSTHTSTHKQARTQHALAGQTGLCIVSRNTVVSEGEQSWAIVWLILMTCSLCK